MDTNEFRQFGKAALDYIADYFDTLQDRPVFHSVKPGYLIEALPEDAPEKGESWQEVFKDVDKFIMPGITHWHSPHFHGYFAAANSFPAIIGDMLSAGFTSIGINWMASPAYTEVVVMNWLGKLLNLPEEFLNCGKGPGGGSLQGSASETTLFCLLTAKEKKVREIIKNNQNISEADIKSKLVAYSSDQSNSSIEKAGLLGSVKMRLLPTKKDGKLAKETLSKAVKEDKALGLIPFYLVACLGTTPTCASDDLTELGKISLRENIWMHIDAAYAGAALACPEHRYLMKGIEYADSFNFSPHKWMLVNHSCSAMWVKDTRHLMDAFSVERIYLKSFKPNQIPEYRHWQIPLGRSFRAMKLWFVLKMYGVEGIQKHIRHHVGLARYFESLVRSDDRFEVCSSNLGLVCIRLKGDDGLTKMLYDKIFERRNIYLIMGEFNGKSMIRFAICSGLTEKRHVDYAWTEFLASVEEVVQFVKNDGSKCEYLSALKKKKRAELLI